LSYDFNDQNSALVRLGTSWVKVRIWDRVKKKMLLSYNSNYMQADKHDAGKKRLAIIIGVAIAVLLIVVLACVELWIHYHKPKIQGAL
jgi:hypothetical protein